MRTAWCGLLCFALCFITSEVSAQSKSPVQLRLDASEAEQALHILKLKSEHRTVPEEEWQKLFATAPYRLLKAREASMKRDFTDAQFREFLESPEAQQKTAVWQASLAAMKQANINAVGERVLAWLPENARIEANVYPEIKPKTNSFVWSEKSGTPTIFLYIEKQTSDQFENTVAHECHHIGLRSLASQQALALQNLPPQIKSAAEWMGEFGEGEAMLAAAGNADRHPHWEDDAVARARWDSDMMNFNSDVATLEQFFNDILDGKLKGDDEIQERAAPFWGAQGAWYTVGYEMSALVEKRFGRKAFTDCLLDPRKLLVLYNQVAMEANAQGSHLATWTPEFLHRVMAEGD